ncbi:MAG: segregation/condensation protein A [Planctomycetes bacterium]|nr:segregation/condensation protein A [Planctomycetota bacterium]
MTDGGKASPGSPLTAWEERLRGEGRYRVDLSEFAGPLDLLLYLIKENEVEIAEIPVARIADQFLAYVQGAPSLDLDQAGEFLVMASTLLEIKSRLLLPDEAVGEIEGVEDLEDPRWELVQQLLAYRKVKEAALGLEARLASREGRVPPGDAVSFSEPVEAGEPQPIPVGAVQLWDLVRAFARVLRETSVAGVSAIRYDDVPVAVHMDRLVTRLETAPERRVSFLALAREQPDRLYLVGLFLALLELVKLRKVAVEQAMEGGDIAIRLRPASDALPADDTPPQEGA